MEEHEIARRGLYEMLRSLPLVAQVRVVESMPGAASALAHQAADLLIVTSDVTEAEVGALLADTLGMLRVLVLIRSGEPRSLAAAVRLPASGFLIEPELTAETLADTLVRLADGERPIPAALADYLLSERRTQRGAWQPPLTPRELQVLDLMTEGLSNREIAHKMGISQHGAKRHVGNILAKLHCPNRTLAVARAIREGLTPHLAEMSPPSDVPVARGHNGSRSVRVVRTLRD